MPILQSVNNILLRKWRYATIAIAVAIICWLASNLAQTVIASTNPVISITRNYYVIAGSTANQLRQQLNQRGPEWTPGQRFDATTRWYVRWSYRYAVRDNYCRLTSNQVRADITITMPKWQMPPRVSKDLVRRWQRYVTALQRHEDGHRDHGINAAREVAQALERFPSRSTCEQLEMSVNTAMMQIIENYSQKDVEYDRVTQHGATQGARFP
ncbi:MAG: DUF922 domain-containing Zn-dependent protease [Cyanobacteria bacterium]|nr:DUF922 domain-containing Zn-dependent protease [Cyanobacteriota bacterium]MDW8202699.1 DUF922 domain-containing protein [Cyanobacteriota bacterium SKYGB_h_bin112]